MNYNKKHYIRGIVILDHISLLRTILPFWAISLAFAVTEAQSANVQETRTIQEQLGLYPESLFNITTGLCNDCLTIPQALWYFQNETIAISKQKPVGFTSNVYAQHDVRAFAQNPNQAAFGLPPLVWIGSRDVLQGKLNFHQRKMSLDGATNALKLVDQLPSNRSYFNQTSELYFEGRQVRARGEQRGEQFIARTLWPLDFNLDFQQLQVQPLQKHESIISLVQAENGGARSHFQARILWQKSPETQLAGKPVLAFILNGAQGDDDESHGGHFAIATGRIGQHGEWHDWLVNNFYDLSTVSEKGIIAAPTPLDAYQADLNSGQSWYRPSYLLVAVLKDERSATLYQQAIGRVYNHFYRQDFLYRHADVNCTGISIETLRSLGWDVPQYGPTSRWKAFAGLPYKAIADRDLESGLKAYDYLITEQTDLLPFVTFSSIGNDLLERLAHTGPRDTPFKGGLAKQLGEDLEAIMFIRLPQFPSSREFGRAPVLSMDEYMKRVPSDRSEWKIVPVGKRYLPQSLKENTQLHQPARPAWTGLFVWATVLVLILLIILRQLLRKTQK